MIDNSMYEKQDLILLSFGNTNSGKTYSIIGKDNNLGLLPLTIDYLF